MPHLGVPQATTTIPTTPAELAEYKHVGFGHCRDQGWNYPRMYYSRYDGYDDQARENDVKLLSECRDLCTTLSTACVGYDFEALTNVFNGAGNCAVYGSMLPDQGTGAAAPGKPLYRWFFLEGQHGASDTLTRGDDLDMNTKVECHAKKLGVSGTHLFPSTLLRCSFPMPCTAATPLPPRCGLGCLA
jgi:hypothetical protein